MTPQPKPQQGLLLIGLGELSPGEHRFDAGRIAIGSGGDNDFVIAHPTVSRKHAILRFDTGVYTVEDLASTNGTFVNGRRIKQPIPLKPGDEIGFGGTRFVIARGTGAPGRAPQHRFSARMIGAVMGIVLFAIAGFVGARYAIYLDRSSTPIEPPRKDAAPAKAVVAHHDEAVTSAAEPSSEQTAEPSNEPAWDTAGDAQPSWLKQLNQFRASPALAPVGSDPKLSDGDQKHAVYILKNFATDLLSGELGAQVHTEDPARSWYTPEGAQAARASDFAAKGSNAAGDLSDPQEWAISGWMTAPFHRLSLLSPLLRDAGFGSACEDNLCVAVLNVLSGADPLPRLGTPLERAILYPPDGATIPAAMRKLDTEWPSPISGCDGFTFPVGIPITVQLGPMVDAQINLFSLAGEDGAAVDACGFDANSYRNPDESERTRVVGGLRSQGAIVIVPRHPLERGARYDVVATVNGRDYKWSFAVAR